MTCYCLTGPQDFFNFLQYFFYLCSSDWLISLTFSEATSILLTSYQEYMILAAWFIIDSINSDHLAERMFVRFLPCGYFYHFLFYILWKQVTKCSPHLWGEELSSSWRDDYLHKLFWILLYRKYISSSYLFVYSVIYFHQYGFMASWWVRICCWIRSGPHIDLWSWEWD